MNARAMMTLRQAQAWISPARLVGDAAVEVARVHTDTRTLESGDLFVALRGERFDGGQFLAQAASQGAVAALCESASQDLLTQSGLPGLIVPDAKAALGALASGWRKQFDLALDRGDRQQWQNHRDTDDRSDPANLEGRGVRTGHPAAISTTTSGCP
jgi:hypothetical protein